MDSPDRGTVRQRTARVTRRRWLAGLAVAVSALLVAAMIAFAVGAALDISIPGV